jgi:hypothetical protein
VTLIDSWISLREAAGIGYGGGGESADGRDGRCRRPPVGEEESGPRSSVQPETLSRFVCGRNLLAEDLHGILEGGNDSLGNRMKEMV